MVKIMSICILICYIFFVSCKRNQVFDWNKYDVVFVYNPWITLDFKSKILKIDYGELKYTDTLNFSKDEVNTIIKSFNANRIYDLKEDVFCYNDTLKISPPSELKIKILAYRNLQSEMIIDENYQNKGHLPFGQKYRVVSFRDDVLKILKANEQIKKALEIFRKYDADLWRSHMVK